MAPVGFRFHPTEQEIILHYLTLKINGHDSLVDYYIGEIDIYRRDPWDLPDFARIQSDDQVWYFFCRLDYKYSNSKRANRATENGYWKLTGKVRDIKLKGSDEVIGTKRNLVFQYKCPDSKKVVGTSWVIHEFQSKTSPPDQRALVLCKLKYKANDSAANSPNDEGEPGRVMGSDGRINGAQTNILEVDPEQLQSYICSNEMDFGFLFPPQSEIGVGHGLSDEEKLFADSFLNVTDEEYIDDAAFTLLNGDSQPRTLRAFAGGSNERATNVTYGDGEASNLCRGRGSSKEHRQVQMAPSDDILLMGASSAGSTAIRHEKINVVHPVGGEFPWIGKSEKPKSPDFVKQEGVTLERFVSRHKAMEETEQGTGINLRQKQSFGLMSEKDRKTSQVPYAKPDGKLRTKESTGNDSKGSFIRFETTSTSQRSSPPSASLLNAIVGLVLFVIMLREVFFIH